jgi:hypothetical protein
VDGLGGWKNGCRSAHDAITEGDAKNCTPAMRWVGPRMYIIDLYVGIVLLTMIDLK